MTVIVVRDDRIESLTKMNFSSEPELQNYVYNNPSVIPISEIKGDDRRLVVLIKEFGIDGGSIDLLGIDNRGDIYVIEVKLKSNSERRKVIAQLLEYGTTLWVKYSNNPDGFIEKLNERLGTDLEERLRDEVGDELFESVIDRIKQALANGSFIFIVLMDELPDDVKNILRYLAKNSNFEVYGLELEFYRCNGGLDIIVPKFFGVELREVEQLRKWNEKSFFEDAKERLNPADVEIIKKLYNFSKENFEIDWGKGKTGSFNVRVRISSKVKTLYSVSSEGRLRISFGNFRENKFERRLAEELKKKLEEIGLSIPNDWINKYPGFKINDWGDKVEKFMNVLRHIKEFIEREQTD